MTVRLLAIDVDGTLANSKGIVTERTRQVLHEAVARGLYVVISTGRSRSFLQCVSDQVALEQPLICNNGAEIWKNAAELLARRFMPVETGQEIIHIFKRYGVEHMWGNDEQGDFSPEMFQQVLQNPPMKLGAFFEDEHQLAAVRAEINALPDIEITSSDELNLEVMKYGTSKAHGLVELATEFSISLDDVMCFGDSYNDMEMFEECGTAVAMGNANDELKAMATYITATNDEDGVAQAIEQYVFAVQEPIA